MGDRAAEALSFAKSVLVGARGLSETFAPGLIAIPMPLGRDIPPTGFGTVVGLMEIAVGRTFEFGYAGLMPPCFIEGGRIAGPGRAMPPGITLTGGLSGGRGGGGRGMERITGGGR